MGNFVFNYLSKRQSSSLIWWIVIRKFTSGAIFENKFFTLSWPYDTPRSDLSLLEFYPIVVATFLWAKELSNKRLKIFTDNADTVGIINKLKASKPNTRALVRIFALHCLSHNIWFQAYHIPGVLNIGPDLLSRNKMEQFHRQFPGKEETLTVLPPHMWPESCLAP